MMREYQVRICERLGVKFPGSTRSLASSSARRFVPGMFGRRLRTAALAGADDVELRLALHACERAAIIVPVRLARAATGAGVAETQHLDEGTLGVYVLCVQDASQWDHRIARNVSVTSARLHRYFVRDAQRCVRGGTA